MIHIAWRNIWRNKRRTVVVLTAVVIGVWAMIIMGALMRGVADQFVRNGIATLTGHIQIHARGYREDPVIENSMTDPLEVEEALAAVLPGDARWCRRIRVNAIASNARHSSGLTLVGIEPEREKGISFVGEAVSGGRHLAPGDRDAIVVGKSLIEKFHTKLDYKLVLMSQDTDREIASRAFKIAGIYEAEMEATEKQFAFVAIEAARGMLKLRNAVSEYSVLFQNNEEADSAAGRLREILPADRYEVSTWKDLLPLVTAILRMYDWFIFLWFFIVFIAMGFGIVNTMLMAVFERIREFGLLKALGMKPRLIVREVLTETLFLLIIGLIVGNLCGLATVYWLSDRGIDLTAFSKGMEFAGMARIIFPIIEMKDLLSANVVVVVLGLLVSCYPAVKAARFTPVEAMART